MSRIAFGFFLVVHGLAHAVFPVRGAGGLETMTIARTIMNALWTVALVVLRRGGHRFLGRPAVSALCPWALAVAATASSLVILAFGKADLFYSLALNIVLVVAAELVRRPCLERGRTAPRWRVLGLAGDSLATCWWPICSLRPRPVLGTALGGLPRTN